MICVSYADFDFKSLSELLLQQKPELAELRMDSLKISTDEYKKLFALKNKYICTCKDKDFFKELSFAIQNGTDYVDINIEAEELYRDKLIHLARANNVKTIVSYHDFEKTPVRSELEYIVDWCAELNPDIIKIACTVKTMKDNVRLLGLLDSQYTTIVVGMGNIGTVTRILAPKLGAFCTFASAVKGKETGPGQLSFDEMQKMTEFLNIV